jgi:hypothetical protein
MHPPHPVSDPSLSALPPLAGQRSPQGSPSSDPVGERELADPERKDRDTETQRVAQVDGTVSSQGQARSGRLLDCVRMPHLAALRELQESAGSSRRADRQLAHLDMPPLRHHRPASNSPKLTAPAARRPMTRRRPGGGSRSISVGLHARRRSRRSRNSRTVSYACCAATGALLGCPAACASAW